MPETPNQLHYTEMQMEKVKTSYIKQAIKKYGKKDFTDVEIAFMADDLNLSKEDVKNKIATI